MGKSLCCTYMIPLTSYNFKMNRKLFTIFLFVSGLLTTTLAKAIEITRVEPANWWVGMKNSELQIMVYGPDISKSTVTINYPGIKLKELAKTTNPNYVFIYSPSLKEQSREKYRFFLPMDSRNLPIIIHCWRGADKSGAAGF